jgi:hypothetical protein
MSYVNEVYVHLWAVLQRRRALLKQHAGKALSMHILTLGKPLRSSGSSAPINSTSACIY